ncbi:hypothetical protein BK120_20140 [Paenibacillus sp. FSL A5-0031]|uniref:hypothetical protein n=1 Tax=Paenibacillus sp. FSL A5-0031 TaxID=1920420 RepID=UPI00096C67D3|nr:hypothetical protein [Paenibacillus sp. FSL A5-0031]OME80147.1 hypothetical protein BK120_20140 [Paenibacillus sp. FSL A5-0031]
MQKLVCIVLFIAVCLSGCSTKSDPAASDRISENTVVEANLPLAQLPVNEIKDIVIIEPDGIDLEQMPKPLATLTEKNEFQAFSDAIKDAVRATGEVVAIGPNYDISVVKYASSEQRFRYWNSKPLKMITDLEVQKSYFLSEEAINQIDELINKRLTNGVKD